MNLILNQAVLHILDTNINTPVLSDNMLVLDDAVGIFLEEHILNSFQSDKVKQCEFLEKSALLTYIRSLRENFLEFSKIVAENFFDVMLRNVDIPCGDLLVVDMSIDSVAYLGVFKLNYKNSFIHYYTQQSGMNCNSIIKQRTVLQSETSRIEEFFFVNIETLDIILSEKKYLIDGIKDYYISNLILECSQNQSEKAKFTTVRKIAEKSLKMYYTDENMINAAVSSLLVDESRDNLIDVKRLEEKVANNYPLAQNEFSRQIEESKMSHEKIYVAPSSVKRLEKQSIKTKNGVVLNIPIELMNEDNIEFINNPDGSVSILIKNVYV